MGFKKRISTIIHKGPSLLATVVMVSFVLLFLTSWVSKNPNFGGDWHYVFTQHIQEQFRIPQLWDSSENLGQNNASRAALTVLDLAQSALNHYFSLDFSKTEVILWFAPFVFGSFFSTYFLSKKLFKNRPAAIFSGLFFTLNTYTLVLFAEAGHINVLVAYSFVPLVVLRLLHLLERQTYRNTCFYVAALSTCFLFDIRIGFISLVPQAILLAHNVLTHKTWRHLLHLLRYMIIAVIAFILVNIYWLVPLLMTPSDQLLAAGQNDPAWIQRLSFQDVTNGLVPSHPFWTLQGITYFSINPVNPLFMVFTLAILLGFILAKQKTLKTMLVFLAIWLIGILFLKGANPPFDGLYTWLFTTLKPFQMFREPQKFYVLVMLPIALLLGISYQLIEHKITELNPKNPGRLKLMYHILFLLIFVISLAPAYLLQLHGNFQARPLPDYAQDVEKLAQNDPNFSRALWIPQVTSSSFHTDLHPRVDANTSFTELFGLKDVNPQTIASVIDSANFDYFVDKASVRYIIFPKDNEVLRWYQTGFDDIIAGLKNNKNYTLVESTSDVTIFENSGYDKLINASLHPVLSNSELNDPALFTNKALLGSQVIFADDNPNLPISAYLDATRVYDLSLKNNEQEITAGKVTNKVSLSENDLFSLTDQSLTQYYTASFQRDSSGRFRAVFVPVQETLELNGQTYTLRSQQISASSGIYLERGADYMLIANGSSQVFTNDEIQRGVAKGLFYLPDPATTKLELYKGNMDLYLNERFDDNKAQLDVGDCNNFDNKTLAQSGINYSFSKDAFDGASSLQLAANTHIACFTKAFFPSSKDTYAVLSLAYKNIEGALPEICLFDHKQDKCTLRRNFADAASSWNSTSILLALDKDTQKYNIYLYANASEQTSVNAYDNVMIEGFSLIDRTDLGISQKPTDTVIAPKVFFQGYDYSSVYSSPVVAPVDFSNKSFEKPVNYQLQAKDCNNSDHSDLEANGIEISQVSDSSDQRFALKIAGNRHTACYNEPLGELTPDRTYTIAFDYKSEANSFSKYCLLNTTSGQCEYLNTLDPGNNWHTEQFQFTPRQAGIYELYLSSFSKLGDGNAYYSIFDNVQAFALPMNYYGRLFLESVPFIKGQEKLPDITYSEISPTRYLVTVDNIHNPFFLNFGMTYSDGWNLYEVENTGTAYRKLGSLLEQNKSTADVKGHLQSDHFRNSWLIDSSHGKLLFYLEYTPQNSFMIVQALSLVFAVLLICVLVGVEVLTSAHKVILRKVTTNSQSRLKNAEKI